jgi:hypothetical protein
MEYDPINTDAGSHKKAKENPMRGLLAVLPIVHLRHTTPSTLSALKTISYK